MACEIDRKQLKYTGTKQPEPDEKDENGRPRYAYLPSPKLIEAVNLAIALERPLLLKGEPGCGKTRLARAVAYELDLPYKDWHIQSTSRARDGRYFYDTVGRLRDAQLAGLKLIQGKELEHSLNPNTYIRWKALGEAFGRGEPTDGRGKPTVVLIDEIDKADPDFPNDLLLELDEQRFDVEETGLKVTAPCAPIVFITSNEETKLPDAFLRRCIFHYIEFPDEKDLIKIVKSRFPSKPEKLVQGVVERFCELRKKMANEQAEKNVSTSELIDWFDSIKDRPEVIKELTKELLNPGVLLKTHGDYQKFYKGLHSKGDENVR